jgi:ABC-type transport system involved in multi-copper enzyme maturation permease subunit
MNSAYGKLCGITGGGLILIGFTLLIVMLVFLGTGQSPIPVDGVGHYFVAFTGSVLVAWGVSLY